MTMTIEPKLVVIDGLDGSGKNTQVNALADYLEGALDWERDKDFTTVDFPRYGKPSCCMVEQYLAGNIMQDPMKVDPYVASTAYSIDRAISFQTEKWGEVYRNGGMVISDRYTQSNIIHQGCKIDLTDTTSQYSPFIRFIRFLYKLEYDHYNIPKPNLVIFLESSKANNESLLKARQEISKNRRIDIHEGNLNYLDKCRYTLDVFKNAYKFFDYDASRSIKFVFIDIDDDYGSIRSVKDIRDDIIRNIEAELYLRLH